MRTKSQKSGQNKKKSPGFIWAIFPKCPDIRVLSQTGKVLRRWLVANSNQIKVQRRKKLNMD
jgi:hypothetical protein